MRVSGVESPNLGTEGHGKVTRTSRLDVGSCARPVSETFGPTLSRLEGDCRDATATRHGRRAWSLRLARHLPADPGPRRAPPRGDDAGGEVGSAGEPLDRSRGARGGEWCGPRAGTRRG